MWAPVLLDEYQVWPDQMGRFTGHEIRDLFRYHAARVRAQREQQEG